MEKKMWVAINYIGISEIGTVFDIKGVFNSEKKAKMSCKKETEGYGPLQLNEELPENIMTWPGFIYPWRPVANEKHDTNCEDCWCNPEIKEMENGNKVIIHNG